MPNQKRTIYGLLAVFLVLLSTALFFVPSAPAPVPYPPEPPEERRLELVAHAGGVVGGYVYSNTLEALQNSVARGYRLIELDFMPTTDGRIVLTHVWHYMTTRVPGAYDHIVSYDVFMSYRLYNRYTPMNLEMLIDFLDEHPDIRVITDTKDGYDAYTALYVIAEQFPGHIHRFIAQAYRFEHVNRIRALGFEDVIVTLYMYPPAFFDDPAEIARLAQEHDVYAITISEYGVDHAYAALLDVENVRFFANTVNNPYRAQELFEMGFFGIYTNFLVPEDGPVPTSWGLAPYIEGQISRLAENLAAFDAEEEAILAEALFYRLDTHVYVRYSEPLPLSHSGATVRFPLFDSGIIAPFAMHDTGVIYLPLGHLLSDDQSYAWERPERFHPNPPVSLTGPSGEYTLPDGFLFYRSRIFLSEAAILEHFPVQLIRLGDYLVVFPEFAVWEEVVLLDIARRLFDGF